MYVRYPPRRRYAPGPAAHCRHVSVLSNVTDVIGSKQRRHCVQRATELTVAPRASVHTLPLRAGERRKVKA